MDEINVYTNYSTLQLLNYTPLFIIGLHGLNSETLKPAILQYIEKISQTDTFIIVCFLYFITYFILYYTLILFIFVF